MRNKIAVFFFCLLLQPLISFGQNTDALKRKKLEIQKTITKTKSILKDVSNSKTYSTNRLRTLNRQIELREKLIIQIKNEINELNNRINDNEYVIHSMNNDVLHIKGEYGKILQYLYLKNPPYFDLIYVFSSNDFNQAYKRLKYIQQYTDYRKKQVHLINEIQKLLEKKKNELDVQKTEMKENLDRLNIEREKVSKEMIQQKNIIGRLTKKEKSLKKEINSKRKIAINLESEIKKLIEEETKRNNGIFKLTPEQKIVSKIFETNKGRLPWPVKNGVITQTYGEHTHPVLKHIITKNDGINITSTEGAKARCVFDGVVVRIVAIPGANQTVIVRHGNYLSVYNNLSEVFIKVGQDIKAKQEIGSVFTDKASGNDTTFQFMIWEGKNKLNPEPWLSK